jgi:hypothetical protein
MTRNHRTRAAAVAASIGLALAVLGAGCGGGESELCKARDDLHDDVGKLGDLNATETSLQDVQDLVGKIGDDLSTIQDTRKQTLKPYTDDLKSSLDSLESTLSNADESSSLSQAASDIVDGLVGVKNSATSLVDAAKDDC